MSKIVSVHLSQLVPSRHNPRRVKPPRVSHETLVALIRNHGLLQPLVVRPSENGAKEFIVIAGSRRLKALREIYRNDGDPKIPCMLKDVDAATADAMSLGENFGREPMHPMDEAEAFAQLARQDGKDPASIAAEFGQTERYVRQRMALASLAKPIKEAYRQDQIDTGGAEALCAVPEAKQLELWKELQRYELIRAQVVRDLIANQMIDLKEALFDQSVLPDSSVTRDLFSEQVLVERDAFLKAQSEALQTQKQSLLDEGWSNVIVGDRFDLNPQLISMDHLEKEFDPATEKQLQKLADRQEKLDALSCKIAMKDPRRAAKLGRLQNRWDVLEKKIHELRRDTPATFSEATKAKGTVFLLLSPDGSVERQYAQPRQSPRRAAEDGNGVKDDAPLTLDDLSDAQRAVLYAHQVLCVRTALLKHDKTRLSLLAIILHDRIETRCLSVGYEPNITNTHIGANGAFRSPLREVLMVDRNKVDPFTAKPQYDEVSAHTMLSQMKTVELSELLNILTVELLFTDPRCPSQLVHELARELKVSIRDSWTPDAAWLKGYQKIQLAELLTKLLGSVNAPVADTKKSALVERLSKLFAEAAAEKMADKKLAAALNAWVPATFIFATKSAS